MYVIQNGFRRFSADAIAHLRDAEWAMLFVAQILQALKTTMQHSVFKLLYAAQLGKVCSYVVSRQRSLHNILVSFMQTDPLLPAAQVWALLMCY